MFDVNFLFFQRTGTTLRELAADSRLEDEVATLTIDVAAGAEDSISKPMEALAIHEVTDEEELGGRKTKAARKDLNEYGYRAPQDWRMNHCSR